jgi:hypothetical protein
MARVSTFPPDISMALQAATLRLYLSLCGACPNQIKRARTDREPYGAFCDAQIGGFASPTGIWAVTKSRSPDMSRACSTL